MTVKIAVLSDAHMAQEAAGNRRGDIAPILLLRAVNRLNRWVQPDVTLILGDLINDPQAAEAEAYLRELRVIVDRIQSPTLVIPGNHDMEADRFYRIFDRPGDWLEVAGVRFVPFLDPEEPGWNARREGRDLDRMAAARVGFAGPLVSVQHVPVFPPGRSECPYNYVNAEAVIEAMAANSYRLAVSGHFHPGMEVVRQGEMSFVAGPALCEAPFRFDELELTDDQVRLTRHSLAIPAELGLVDLHVHTHLAYCNENMTVRAATAFGREMGLAEVAFAEHTSHLYYDREVYSSGAFLNAGVDGDAKQTLRVKEYFAALEEADCPQRNWGLEADCDFRGRPVVREEDRSRVNFIIGAVHRLPAQRVTPVSEERMAQEFLSTCERLVRSGIQVLAHPFRVFRRTRIGTPRELFRPLARMLREHGVAAEINYHTNEPPAEFFRLCLEDGVRITFGSDAHNLYEVGEFWPHLRLLEECGFSGRADQVLFDPRRG